MLLFSLISLLITLHLLLQPQTSQTPLQQPVQVSLPEKESKQDSPFAGTESPPLPLPLLPSFAEGYSQLLGRKEKIRLFSLFRNWIFYLLCCVPPSPSPGCTSLLPCCYTPFPLSLSVSLALSAGVCGCAGGQHESCGSHGVVRESDRRRGSPYSSPLSPCIPPTADEGGREGW